MLGGGDDKAARQGLKMDMKTFQESPNGGAIGLDVQTPFPFPRENPRTYENSLRRRDQLLPR